MPLDLRASLDHLILGVSDLARGIEYVEQRTGVRAALGGVHPGRGTRNALLSLGPQCYLEILAPDPNQQTLTWFRSLPELTEPRLVGWMVHPAQIDVGTAAPGRLGATESRLVSDQGTLETLAERLCQAGIPFEGPRESSRQRPDGRTLRWKLLRLADDGQDLDPQRPRFWRAGLEGMLPILIEWSADSPHPAADAPSGLSLVRFEVASPNPDELQRALQILGVDLPVARVDHPQLRARIAGPRGTADLIS